MYRPPVERPFSSAWLIVSVILFLGVELLIGTWIGPLVIGKYVSPVFNLQVQALMHLASFYVGGVLVGLLSPGIRMKEPAAGAFISVLVVFLMSFFMPHWYYRFDLQKVLIGGGIAVVLALAGAYSGEKMMGNIEPDDLDAQSTTRGKLRAALWNDADGMLGGRSRDRDASRRTRT